MDQILDILRKFLDVNTILFSAFGYQMSYLEFIGTLLNLWSVWLVTRNNIWTWPVGNVAVLLFAILFYQIRLYSDLFEQVYFLITGFYGWWFWAHARNLRGIQHKAICLASMIERFVYIAAIALGTIFLTYTMSNIHLWLPQFFPEPASYPFLDAFTTVMSFAATILMAHKRIECWILWILVDVIGIWLYFAKGVVIISALYFVFLILATSGLLNWKRLSRLEADAR